MGRALQACESGLSCDPDDGALWELKGLLLGASGYFESARHAFEVAMSLVPLSPEAWQVLADCYARQDDIRSAHAILYDLVRRDDVAPQILLRAAVIWDDMRLPKYSLAACRKALRCDEGSAQAWYELGYYMRRCGYPPHLVASAARRAVDLAPDCLNYRMGLAGFLSMTGLSSEAYQVAAVLTPARIQGVNCLCCLEKLERIFEVAGDSERALACRQRHENLADDAAAFDDCC